MTRKRMLFLQELGNFMGMAGRLRLEWISSAEAQRFVQVVTEFTEQIRKLGPNPLAQGYGRAWDHLDLPAEPQAAAASSCGSSQAAAGG